jgi:hypothetical protein
VSAGEDCGNREGDRKPDREVKSVVQRGTGAEQTLSCPIHSLDGPEKVKPPAIGILIPISISPGKVTVVDLSKLLNVLLQMHACLT